MTLETGPQLTRRYRKHEMNVILFVSLVLIMKTGLSREKWTVYQTYIHNIIFITADFVAKFNLQFLHRGQALEKWQESQVSSENIAPYLSEALQYRSRMMR